MSTSDQRTAFARRYLQELQSVLDALPLTDLAEILGVLERALCDESHVFLAGNGGSAATASHMANDLMKTAAGKSKKRGLCATALSDNAQIVTAIANDESYDVIFSRQLQMLAHPGDILIIISGSGNSPNILEAVKTAKKMGLRTIGFLGMDGGEVKDLLDCSIIVPSDDYGPIEDVHVIFNHLITAYLREQSYDQKADVPVPTAARVEG